MTVFPFATAAAAAPRGARAAPLDLPSLRDGAERLATSLGKTLQTMAGESTLIEGAVGGMATMPLRDVIASHRAETVAATISCQGVPCTLLLTLDPVLVHTLVELLTGGDGTEPPPDVPRPATTVDAQFTQILATLIAAGIEREWRGFGPVKAQRVEGALPADVCGPRLAAVGVVTLALTIFGHRGAALLAHPQAALDAFPQAEPPPAKPVDARWSEGLQRGLGRAPIRVEAYLDAKALPLGAIAALAVGDVVELAPAAQARASLVCDERTFYRGELGLDDDGFCIRVAEPVARSLARPADASPAPSRPTPPRTFIFADAFSLTQAATAPDSPGVPATPPHLRSIMQIPVEVRVFLGAASMPVAELMALQRGAVVPLDHRVSDPVDVVVNGRVIARGELIALDDDPARIGVKLTEIVDDPAAGN